MTDIKTTLRAQLLASSTLLALVPATTIFYGWPNSFSVLPCISYKEIDNYNTDMDYADNMPYSDHFTVQLDIWTAQGKTTTPIAQAISNVMESNLWNRDAGTQVDLVEPDTKLNHKVMRYSTVINR